MAGLSTISRGLGFGGLSTISRGYLDPIPFLGDEGLATIYRGTGFGGLSSISRGYIKKAPPPSFADQNLNWFSRIILSLQVWL
jgi:hypothetical protein